MKNLKTHLETNQVKDILQEVGYDVDGVTIYAPFFEGSEQARKQTWGIFRAPLTAHLPTAMLSEEAHFITARGERGKDIFSKEKEHFFVAEDEVNSILDCAYEVDASRDYFKGKTSERASILGMSGLGGAGIGFIGMLAFSNLQDPRMLLTFPVAAAAGAAYGYFSKEREQEGNYSRIKQLDSLRSRDIEIKYGHRALEQLVAECAHND